MGKSYYNKKQELSPIEVISVVALLFIGIYHVAKLIFKAIAYIITSILNLIFQIKKESDIKKLENEISALKENQLISNNVNKIDDFDKFSINSLIWLEKALNDNNSIYSSSEVSINKIDTVSIISNIYNDIKNKAETKNLDFLNGNFYIDEFNKYFNKYQIELDRKLKLYILTNDNSLQFSYNESFKLVYPCMPSYVNYRFDSLVNENIRYSIKDKLNITSRIYETNGSYNIHDFIYIVDTFVMCICIAKIFFIEKTIIEIEGQTEFYKIAVNMIENIKNIELVKEKLKVLCNKFYKEELKNITDDFSLNMLISILYFKIRNKKENNEIIFESKTNSINTFNKKIYIKLDELAKQMKKVKIHDLLIRAIKSNVGTNDINTYISLMEKLNEYEAYYNKQLDDYKAINDRERYLNNDFSKEQEIMEAKYNLNNITTGTQFELYLVNLFKDLKYKAKHTGKAGDQGADLILKKDDYIYVVQAKYYTGKLNNTPIQEIAGAIKYYNANQGVVITNSTFTTRAKELAKANDIILIDGKGLRKLVDFIFSNEDTEDILQKF